MNTQDPSGNQEQTEQYGMDMTLPGAHARWREILYWVRADLAPDNLEFGGCEARDSWKPNTEEEREEERFLRRLLLAKTAEAIGNACWPSFLIKGEASPEDEKKFPSAVVDLEEAFRRLAKTFNLTDEEAYQTRLLVENPYVLAEEVQHICAEKFNIIRQAVETTTLVADLSDRKAIIESTATALMTKVAPCLSTDTEKANRDQVKAFLVGIKAKYGREKNEAKIARALLVDRVTQVETANRLGINRITVYRTMRRIERDMGIPDLFYDARRKETYKQVQQREGDTDIRRSQGE